MQVGYLIQYIYLYEYKQAKADNISDQVTQLL